jgi:hypothetical protein
MVGPRLESTKSLIQNVGPGITPGGGKNLNERFQMKKLLSLLAVMGLGILTLATDLPKVPAETQAEILRAQKDQILQQAYQVKLQSEYVNSTNAVKDDQAKILRLKAEALKTASLDPAKFDLNVDSDPMQFVEIAPAKPAVPSGSPGSSAPTQPPAPAN